MEGDYYSWRSDDGEGEREIDNPSIFKEVQSYVDP